MRLHEDSLKEVSAKTVVELTDEDYKKKIKKLKTGNKLLKFACNLAAFAMMACVAVFLLNTYAEKKNSSHTPVTVEMVSAEAGKTPKDQYTPRVKQAYIKNGKTYYNVTLGNYTTLRTEREKKIFGMNTVCDTEIYTLTLKNQDKFFLSAIVPGKITIVRYSIFGENPFTEDEIEEYRKMAADYFTWKKYSRLGFKDAGDFKADIKGLAQSGF